MSKIKEMLKISLQLKNLFKYNSLVQGIGVNAEDLGVLYKLTDSQTKDLLNSLSKSRFSSLFPIYTLTNKKTFIIQAKAFKQIKVNNISVILVPYPLVFLIINRIKVEGLREIFKKLRGLESKIKLSPYEFISIFILRILNSYENLDVYTTISGVKTYPIEFYFFKMSRKYRTNVLHYSQNSVEMKFEDENIRPNNSMVDPESLGDIHWVWTKSYARYLQGFNSNIDFRDVGSITFRIPEKPLNSEKKNIITIFDVTPIVAQAAAFYDDDLMVNFVSDVILIKEKNDSLKNFQIQIKSKRQINDKHHSANYIDFLESTQKSGKITIIPWDINPYDLIAESKLIISIPFTSIAYIGLEMGTQTVFYYPYLRRLSNPLYLDIIDVLYGKEQLEKYIIDSLV
jgi:polysaccharide biosynthesis PFTS motif protein